MIKINDRFSMERTQRCWTLYDKRPSDNPKNKSGFSVRESYYSRLGQVVDEIFDRTPEGCKSLREMYLKMQQVKKEVFQGLKG
jgi:hypothetical protein